MGDVGAVPSSLPRSCSPVKSWKGLFWSGHITVLPWTKQQELSTATPHCSLTPQPCSIPKNKRQRSNSSDETKTDNKCQNCAAFFLKRLPFSLLLHWHTKQNTNYALTPTLVSVLWLLTSITKNKVAQMQMLGYLFSTNLEMKTKLVKINYNPSFFQFFSL